MKIHITKHLDKLLIGSLMLLCTVGCSDFLDETDATNLSPETFYTPAKHAEPAIAAIYAETRFVGDGAGIFSSNWQLLEAPTGTSTTQTAQNSDLNNLYSLSYDANTLHIKNWWGRVYRVVANANLVLANVPEIE